MGEWLTWIPATRVPPRVLPPRGPHASLTRVPRPTRSYAAMRVPRKSYAGPRQAHAGLKRLPQFPRGSHAGPTRVLRWSHVSHTVPRRSHAGPTRVPVDPTRVPYADLTRVPLTRVLRVSRGFYGSHVGLTRGSVEVPRGSHAGPRASHAVPCGPMRVPRIPRRAL